MKQWNSKMKKACLETLKTLINELNRPGISDTLLRKKLLVYTNIDKVEIFHVLCNKVALLTMRHSQRGARNRHQRVFRKVWTIIYIENVDQKDEFFMTLMKLRLDFLFTDLSQCFGIDLMVFALKFFIQGHGCKRWRKVICVVKLKVLQHHIAKVEIFKAY